MAVPHSTGNFGDSIDKRVTKLFYDELQQYSDRISLLYSVESSSDAYEISSEIGALDDFVEFQGTVSYGSQNQGYDVRANHIEFTKGLQIERKLYDDDRHNIWQRRPKELANSAWRTRQKHAARILNNAFSVDSMFYTHSEGVALCSDSHTTTSGASTTVGFDNLTTSALSAVSLTAARIQMMGFLDDIGNKYYSMPDELWIPIDLFEVAQEIVESSGKVDTANNNVNVHKGSLSIMPEKAGWLYLTDANNWFLTDSRLRKQFLTWYERVPLEFAMAEELDTLIAKWRAYMRYSHKYQNWRFMLGAQVS
jgi:phage major head subunit gpT-like protein